MSNPSNLAAILESDTLTYIRVMGIFLVASIALFSFTDKGKIFSLISGLISLILGITITVYYFTERSRLSKFGFYTKSAVDILMYVMIAVIILNIWILYEVWNTDQVSLTKIAADIEEQVKQANIQDIAKQIEKQVELSNLQNQMLINALSGKPISSNSLFPDLSTNLSSALSANQTLPSTGPLTQAPSTSLGLRNIEKIRQTVNTAALAMVA